MDSSVMAFDILPMASPYRAGGVQLAVSLKLEDGSTKEWSQVSRSKLIKLVSKYHVRYLGTDNPSEVIGDGESVASFCDMLPSSCNFVHVNLTRTGVTVPLQNLLIQYGISHKKLSPVKTARALVELILKGVGMILDPYENETLIKVSRPKGSSRGGWSQARYQRQNEEIVAREANKIKQILKNHKVAFDEITYDTKYGAKMSRFHVFNSKSEVDRLLSQLSVYPAKVSIWSPKKQVVTHRPLDNGSENYRLQSYSHLQKLIVGIDPGMTTGVAVLNLRGKLITAFSRKNVSKGEIASELADYGIPILVCADVYPVPNFVQKLAATYNAELHAPDIELSKEDKRALAKQSGVNHRINSHEQDAIAAVMNAYQKLALNFKKIDDENLPYKQTEMAKGLLIRGLSVADSLTSVKLINSDKEELIDDISEIPGETKEMLLGRITNLLAELAISEEIISNLRAHTGRLSARNEILETNTQRIKDRFHQLENQEIRKSLSEEAIERKDEIIQSLRQKSNMYSSIINNQKQQISDLEELLWVSLEHGGIPVKILEKFSHEAIEALRKDRGINPDDIIYIQDPTGGGPQTAENLSQVHLKFVFLQEKDIPSAAREVFYQKGIPVWEAGKYGITVTNYLGIINQQNLLRAQEDYNQYVQQRKAKEKELKIFQEIENYKYQRTKEILENVKSYDDFEPEEEEVE